MCTVYTVCVRTCTCQFAYHDWLYSGIAMLTVCSYWLNQTHRIWREERESVCTGMKWTVQGVLTGHSQDNVDSLLLVWYRLDVDTKLASKYCTCRTTLFIITSEKIKGSYKCTLQCCPPLNLHLVIYNHVSVCMYIHVHVHCTTHSTHQHTVI